VVYGAVIQQRERVTNGIVLVNTSIGTIKSLFSGAPVLHRGELAAANLDNRLGLKYFGVNYQFSFAVREIHEDSFCYTTHGKLGSLG
jgi:hypothetical protein